jgi:hypothetical protein
MKHNAQRRDFETRIPLLVNDRKNEKKPRNFTVGLLREKI